MQFFNGYLALGTGSTSFVELTATDYVRHAFEVDYIDITMAASSAGAIWTAASDWPTITQLAFFDSGGNKLGWWMLTHPALLTDGETFLIPPGWSISTLISGSGLYPPGTTIARLTDGTPIVSGFVQMLNGAIANNPAAPKVLPTHDPAILGGLWNQAGTVLVSNGFGLTTSVPPSVVHVGTSFSGLIGTIQIDPNIDTSDLDIQGLALGDGNPIAPSIEITRQDSLCSAYVVDYALSELGQLNLIMSVTYIPDTSAFTGVGAAFVVQGDTPSATFTTSIGAPPHNWSHTTPIRAYFWFAPAWSVDIGAYTFGVQFTDTVIPLTPTIDRQANTLAFPPHTFTGTGTAHVQLTATAPGHAPWTSNITSFPLV